MIILALDGLDMALGGGGRRAMPQGPPDERQAGGVWGLAGKPAGNIYGKKLFYSSFFAQK